MTSTDLFVVIAVPVRDAVLSLSVWAGLEKSRLREGHQNYNQPRLGVIFPNKHIYMVHIAGSCALSYDYDLKLTSLLCFALNTSFFDFFFFFFVP